MRFDKIPNDNGSHWFSYYIYTVTSKTSNMVINPDEPQTSYCLQGAIKSSFNFDMKPDSLKVAATFLTGNTIDKNAQTNTKQLTRPLLLTTTQHYGIEWAGSSNLVKFKCVRLEGTTLFIYRALLNINNSPRELSQLRKVSHC